MPHKQAETSEQIHELISGRWSPRAFDREKSVSHAQLIAMLEAARWAPSCFGDQPWRFVVADRGRDESAWQAMFACLAEKNRLWAAHAPLLVLACAWPQFRHNSEANRWAEYDTGAAVLSLSLQAHAMGLATHQMGGFDVESIRDACALPQQAIPMAVIAVGYQAGVDVLDAVFHDMEQGKRQRLPLAENFFAGRWGNPVSA
jgi:nitroreductase